MYPAPFPLPKRNRVQEGGEIRQSYPPLPLGFFVLLNFFEIFWSFGLFPPNQAESAEVQESLVYRIFLIIGLRLFTHSFLS